MLSRYSPSTALTLFSGCFSVAILVIFAYSISHAQSQEHGIASLKKEETNWARQINTFRSKVKQACIDDAPTLKFETLRVEAAGIKLKRPQLLDSSTEWTKTETGKLDSAIKLINRWLDFLKIKEKGDLRYAQSKMDYFLNTPTPYPILDKRFFDEKVKSILRERGVTETKRTEYRDGKMVSYIHTQTLEKPLQTASLAKRQQAIIKKLEAGNWDGITVSGYAKELKTLGEKEKHSDYWQKKTNRTIDYFADCLLALEKNDLAKAQGSFLFTGFGRTSLPTLKKLERIVMIELFPSVHPNWGVPPLDIKKTLSQYKFELLAEPKNMKDASTQRDLAYWLDNTHWGEQSKNKRAWKKAADGQYFWLSQAQSALESKNFPRALYYLRTALYHSPDAGPATAQALIESEIRKLTQSHPELFTLSIEERLVKAEEQVSELESILKKTQ